MLYDFLEHPSHGVGVLWCVTDSYCQQVALGLPLLPKVPITKAEAKRRASVKLLPLGMALLAAESFVQERLHSADICMSILGS